MLEIHVICSSSWKRFFIILHVSELNGFTVPLLWCPATWASQILFLNTDFKDTTDLSTVLPVMISGHICHVNMAYRVANYRWPRNVHMEELSLTTSTKEYKQVTKANLFRFTYIQASVPVAQIPAVSPVCNSHISKSLKPAMPPLVNRMLRVEQS